MFQLLESVTSEFCLVELRGVESARGIASSSSPISSALSVIARLDVPRMTWRPLVM